MRPSYHEIELSVGESSLWARLLEEGSILARDSTSRNEETKMSRIRTGWNIAGVSNKGLQGVGDVVLFRRERMETE
jgi:hypothetical protein